MEPMTFSFTVTLSHQTYVLLRRESRQREGRNGAVPSRTARQLIEERLQEMTATKPAMPTEDETDKPQQKSKKPRSTKIDVGADESTPTI